MESTDVAVAERPRRRGRPRDERASEAILSATLRVIAEMGFGGFTMRAVADQAGVGLPTIYRRWRSKEDLAREAIDAALGRAMPVPDTGSLREDLRILLHELVDYLNDPQLGGIWLALISESRRDGTWLDSLEELTTSRRHRVRVVVQRAVDRGELPRSVDVDLFLDMVQGPMWVRMLHLHRTPTHQAAEQIISIVLLAFGVAPV
jgi:AcrR family transcriptional regulator